MSNHTESGLPKWFRLRYVVVASFAYIIAFASYLLIVLANFGTPPDGGVFGDMFGAFNAFVSGVAMLGILGALLLQREQNRMQSNELQLQRKELEDTRKELSRQGKALEDQNEDRLLTRWQENKPVVFFGQDGDGYPIVKNVGGGFAVNVYVIIRMDGTDHSIGVGALAAGSTMRVRAPQRSIEVASNFGCVVVAEGVPTRTRRWNPTLNWRKDGHPCHAFVATAEDIRERDARDQAQREATLTLGEYVKEKGVWLYGKLYEARNGPPAP